MEEEEGQNKNNDHHCNNKVLLKYICKLCKKRFPCGRSLGGHMRSHLRFEAPHKRKRSERKIRKRSSSSVSSSSSSSCVDISEEAVAMCLIMLSRDVSGRKMSKKRSGAFECTICDKTFHSYQALGGHKASHKNTKPNFLFIKSNQIREQEEVEEKEEEEAKIISTTTSNATKGQYHCPICLKVFPSGQALGGHKRSHLIIRQADHEAAIDVVVVPKIRDLLDLNLPAPTHSQGDEDEDEDGDFVANSLNPLFINKSLFN